MLLYLLPQGRLRFLDHLHLDSELGNLPGLFVARRVAGRLRSELRSRLLPRHGLLERGLHPSLDLSLAHGLDGRGRRRP